MKRLLIIGESLPLPSDELQYDDTWIHLMQINYPDLEIVDKCVRSRSIITLMHGGPEGKAKNLYEWYNPDFIILHLGISDCAPRLLPRKKKITKLINHLPFSNLIYSFFRKHGGRLIEYADVAPQEFKENLEGYVKKVAPTPVGIVQISKVTTPTLIKSPQFNKAIDLYNAIINQVALENTNATLILGLDGTDISSYQSDGLHLSAKGQKQIFKRCSEYINTLNSIS